MSTKPITLRKYAISKTISKPVSKRYNDILYESSNDYVIQQLDLQEQVNFMKQIYNEEYLQYKKDNNEIRTINSNLDKYPLKSPLPYHNLDNYPANSLDNYSSTGYMDINNTLLNRNIFNKIWDNNTEIIHHINDIDNIFKDIPATTTPFYVYRGWLNMYNILNNSKQIICNNYLSTSLNLTKCITGFTWDYNSVVIKILIPANTKVIPIPNVHTTSSSNLIVDYLTSEYEILLPRGGKLIKTKMTMEPYELNEIHHGTNAIDNIYVFIEKEAEPIYIPMLSKLYNRITSKLKGGKLKKKTVKKYKKYKKLTIK